eukprot:scaffold7131_cov131-Isochrysis_galbana.AAC.3
MPEGHWPFPACASLVLPRPTTLSAGRSRLAVPPACGGVASHLLHRRVSLHTSSIGSYRFTPPESAPSHLFRRLLHISSIGSSASDAGATGCGATSSGSSYLWILSSSLLPSATKLTGETLTI